MNKSDKLVNGIKTFIKIDTDRALQIDGRWGTGKTYFINHRLLDEVKKMGYTPILVSVSGMKSYESIIKEINFGIIRSIDENNISMKSLTLMNTVLKQFPGSNIKGVKLDNLSKNIENHLIKSNKKDKLVLILDDFERSGISYNSFYEYIVQIQSQYKCKMIIVSSEMDMNYRNKDTVKPKLKEKIIYKTFNFELYYNEETTNHMVEEYLQDINISNSQKKWIINIIIKLLEISKYPNLRLLEGYLINLQAIISRLTDIKNENNEGIINDAIKTACVSCYALSSMMNNINRNVIEQQLNTFKDMSANSITFMMGLRNGENGQNIDESISCEKYLVDHFHNKIEEYDKNACYFYELYDFLNNGYLDYESYLKKIYETQEKNDFGLIEEMMAYLTLDINDLENIQKQSNDKYLKNTEFTSRTDSKYVNNLCIMYELYNQFVDLNILKVPGDSLEKIKSIIIKIVNDKSLYDPINYSSAIDAYYSDLIYKIDEDRSIKNIINKNKEEINQGFALNVTKEMLSRRVITSKYADSFKRLHIFTVLSDENNLNKICTEKGCCFFIDENIKHYVIDNSMNLDDDFINEVIIFKDKLSSKNNKVNDPIIRINLSHLNKTLDNLLSNNYSAD